MNLVQDGCPEQRPHLHVQVLHPVNVEGRRRILAILAIPELGLAEENLSAGLLEEKCMMEGHRLSEEETWKRQTGSGSTCRRWQCNSAGSLPPALPARAFATLPRKSLKMIVSPRGESTKS